MKNSIRNLTTSWLLLSPLVFIFLINPFLGILSLILTIIITKSTNKILFYTLGIFIGVYFGLMNTTRLISEDLFNYYQYFCLADTVSFFQYITLMKEEILFVVGTYFLSKLLLQDFNLYLVILTTLIYFFVFISIYKYFRYTHESFLLILFAFLLFAFTYNVFLMSTHLTRQMLASSLFMYFLVEKSINQKNRWIFLFSAVLIHYSSAILFVFAFLPDIQKKINFNLFFVLIALLIVSIFGLVTGIFAIAAKFTDQISFLNFSGIIGRITPHYDLRYFVIDQTRIITNYYYVWVLVAAIFLYCNQKSSHNAHIFSYIYICFFLFLVILYENGLRFIYLRIKLYMSFFFPFILPCLLTTFKDKKKYLFIPLGQIVILFIFIFFFLKMYTKSTWLYSPIGEILTNSVMSYF